MEGTESDTGLRETLSLWIAEGREVLRLIAPRASTSPRLKEPVPCLNSHWAAVVSEELFEELGLGWREELVEFEPWKVSLTLWKPYILS